VIRELLVGSAVQRLALKKIYAQLPSTSSGVVPRSDSRTTGRISRAETGFEENLCSITVHSLSTADTLLLPVAALTAVQLLVDIVPKQRHQLRRRMIRYFFLNPVEICMCPFLEGQECLIYQDRFLGCRAYGLWSKGYYQQRAEHSRKAKRLSQEQWQRLGVSLPPEVVDFHLDYCPYVELEEDVPVDDENLIHASDTIEAISGQLAPWHDSFRQGYFSDLSFLLVSNVLGSQEVAKRKDSQR
jgi:Fe-S-cluster containining protein